MCISVKYHRAELWWWHETDQYTITQLALTLWLKHCRNSSFSHKNTQHWPSAGPGWCVAETPAGRTPGQRGPPASSSPVSGLLLLWVGAVLSAPGCPPTSPLHSAPHTALAGDSGRTMPDQEGRQWWWRKQKRTHYRWGRSITYVKKHEHKNNKYKIRIESWRQRQSSMSKRHRKTPEI